MKKKLKRGLSIAGGSLVALAIALVVIVEARSHRTFEAPTPSLSASNDPTVIARGKYLAYGPAHCSGCHGPADYVVDGTMQGTPPLTGGYAYPSEIGVLHFPNLTPDEETGIGRYTDGQLARMIRHGVKPNGEAQLPVMEYQNISDEDVVALLSFLRSQEPVHNPVPAHQLNFMGKMVKAFLIEPVGPEGAPPAQSPDEKPSVERGEYLANRVAQCAGCHTQRSMVDFSFTGPRFAGGPELEEPWWSGWDLTL